MIDNDFAYELTIDLDMPYLAGLVKRLQKATKEGLAGHQRIVSEDPYLTSIKERFPFLSPYFNIYQTRPDNNIVLHIDAKRNCAFNIPIANTQESSTAFYKFEEDPILEYNERFVYNEVKSKVSEVFKFTLTRPTLINNTVPHDVKHWGTANREIISWSVEQGMLYEQAKDLFKQAGH